MITKKLAKDTQKKLETVRKVIVALYADRCDLMDADIQAQTLDRLDSQYAWIAKRERELLV
jgi:hypothetical protein